jgi:DNA polymerase
MEVKMIKTLSIDIETFSDIDLRTSGVYKYAQSENFEVLLFSYSADGEKIKTVDLACGEKIPADVLDAVARDDTLKWAFNASFERICLSEYIRREYPLLFRSYSINADTTGDYLSPVSWRCSMVWSSYLGLPMSLAGAGEALKLTDRKMTEGRSLIRYFSVPCRPTKVNGGRTRNLPSHDPEKWETYKRYNRRDVEVELTIKERLANYPVPESVWDEYHLSEEINDRGIRIDTSLVRNATKLDSAVREKVTEEMKDLTGLDNPNSVQQLSGWLSGKGVTAPSLDKKAVSGLISGSCGEVKEALLMRRKLAKSSVRKYQAMERAACSDNRVRGMFMFYGASRTGRFAGRHVQLQNLPQNHAPDLAEARELVRSGNFEAAEMLYDNVPSILSELIRTAFIPRDGYKFCVADFSAVEARCLAYLAGETWRMKAFDDGKDIYCESASRMFSVPVEKHGVNGHLRQKGKIAELALGYGGSVGALKAMGALDMGMKEEELRPIVNAWRAASPNIIKFWWDVDKAAKDAVKMKTEVRSRGFTFTCKSGMLFIGLPSGRSLSYVKPRIGENRFGGECITYMGTGPSKKWERLETYGPKLTENICQAVCSDILKYAMRTLSYCFIVAHVHDEIIIECSRDVSVDAVCSQMSRTPPWIPGLNLKADGYDCEFYRKD